ncbi:MAG: HAMP domain-containing sensor histidine kinase [Prolixibacteraceae bacterium]|jgi:signal transduction histidine kinase
MSSTNETNIQLENCRLQLEKLQKENLELTRSLYKVNEKLQDSERLKGHFISNITNEIVNPFASILALAENLKYVQESQMDQVRQMAELIFGEAFHLDFQLKNIFAVALIEAGKEELKFSEININQLCDRVSGYFKPLLLKKNVQLIVNFSNKVVPEEQIIFGSDIEKLELILKNLISNSIKFSIVDSFINLDFVLEVRNLIVEVSDHGKGIPQKDQHQIFDRFKQLDEKINSINTGHGLGLSIVQAYSEMLGGKVTVGDNFEGGIRMRVSLPEYDDANEWDELEDFLLDSEPGY